MKTSNFANKESIKKDVREVNTLLENNLKGYIGDIRKEHIYLNSLTEENKRHLLKKCLNVYFDSRSKYVLIHHNIKGDGFYSIINKKDNNRINKQYTSLFFLSMYIKRKNIKISKIICTNSYNSKGV